MAIKVQVLRKAFYEGAIIRVGEIITIKGNTVPSWAKRIGKTQPDEQEQKQQKQVEQQKEKTSETPKEDAQIVDESGKEDKTEEQEQVAEQEQEKQETPKTDEELEAELNALLDKLAEENIMVDGLENKTLAEQVEILKEKLLEIK